MAMNITERHFEIFPVRIIENPTRPMKIIQSAGDLVSSTSAAERYNPKTRLTAKDFPAIS